MSRPSASARTAAGASRPLASAAAWLRAHDPGYVALRRAARAAVIMPAVFALADEVIGNPALATFAAFGSFAMLLLVDFAGTIRDRLLAQAALGVACAVLICLGTLVSRTTWLAAVGMGVVGFAVLFSGVVSSVLAGATTPLLLAFILPVTIPGPVSVMPDRVLGWGLAAAVSLPAVALLWPSPARNPIRAAAIAGARALAARLQAEIDYLTGDRSERGHAVYDAAVARAAEAVDGLQSAFFATPGRPTGLTTAARAVVRLVDELRWLDTVVLRERPPRRPPAPHRAVGTVKHAAADVLEQAADLLAEPCDDLEPLHGALDRLRAALAELERATTTELPAAACRAAGDGLAGEVVSWLDPSFRAQELSFVVLQIATNAELAVASERRTWLARLLGRQPAGLAGPLVAAQQRAGAHVERHSLWLHNSLRAAIGLALAIVVADVSGVEHGFWVAFGTLSVLRSNALSTGQNLIRALAGTTIGFAVGGLLVYLIGTSTEVLWVLLPFAILLAGLAPAAISFAAGQAGFTLTLLILFNILAPAGWRIGLIRVQDVALGGAVSLAVGLLFWPRGAGAALRRSLAEAYADSARYLAAAVAYGVARCDAAAPQQPRPDDDARRAAAASRRLDDTFRGYLAERGPKRVALPEVTGLVTGVAGVRLAGDAVLDLWSGDGARGGDRSAARRELLTASEHMTDWFGGFAAGLTGERAVPDPLAADQVADGRLVAAVDHDLRAADGQATAAGVRVIWTGDHLDAVRRLQEDLVGPARAAVSDHALIPPSHPPVGGNR